MTCLGTVGTMETCIDMDPSDPPGELRRLCAAVVAFAEANALPQRTADAVEQVLEEALTNVVLYGFPGPSRAPAIRVRLVREPQRVSAVVRDTGCPFDPTAMSEAPRMFGEEGTGAGGRGIRMMRRLSDGMSYRHHDGWNELHLEWHCPDTPADTAGSASREKS